jgi:transglutaminase-like putative cysteine protease
VSSSISYQSREAEGTQTPKQTLDRGWGLCRDFAVLFAEAVRCLGFGARIVSGYLFNSDQISLGSEDQGSTHAWVEAFVPGAGWITFDPTNRSMGGPISSPSPSPAILRNPFPSSAASLVRQTHSDPWR